MLNRSNVEPKSENDFTCAGSAYKAFEDWIDRDLNRLERRWMFLSSPKTRVWFAILERGDQVDA